VDIAYMINISDGDLKAICRDIGRRTKNRTDFNAELKRKGITHEAAVVWDLTGRMFMGTI
jgi:hypothetical protein